MDAVNFSQILSSTITPVTLLTGVAFITSIMTPRFGRCIDRIRVILNRMQEIDIDSQEYETHSRQLNILYGRTKLLRNSMVSAGFCILFIALTVGFNFVNLILGLSDSLASIVFFLLALVSLLFLALGFTFDFVISLKAVKLEIDAEGPVPISNSDLIYSIKQELKLKR